MVFFSLIAVSVTLIALVLGVMVLVWGLRNEGRGVLFAKLAGIVVIIIAVLTLLCAAYHGVWGMATKRERLEMMQGKMMNCPAMMQICGGKTTHNP